MLICSGAEGIEWFARGDGTKRLGPQKPGPDTYAHEVRNSEQDECSGDILTSAWFDHRLPTATKYMSIPSEPTAV